MNTPFEDGYRFPAEWEPHKATWLTYPHHDDSFPGKLESVYPSYMRFIGEIAKSEKVRINVPAAFKNQLNQQLDEAGVDRSKVEIFERESNDVWCRDHGPAFVVKDKPKRQKAIGEKTAGFGGKSEVHFQCCSLVSKRKAENKKSISEEMRYGRRPRSRDRKSTRLNSSH